jgi:hypothetical protein
MVSLNYVFSLYVNLKVKCGAVVEYLTVDPMYAGSLPSVVTFEIFLLVAVFLPQPGFDPGSSMKQA